MNTVSDLIGQIVASQGEIALALARGNATNWDAYNRLVGRHEGLQQALDILNNLMKEEDDEQSGGL